MKNQKQLIFKYEGDIHGLYKRQVAVIDDSRRLEIGIYPVMYGYRVRVGIFMYPEEEYGQTYELDLCCGAHANDVSLVYILILSLLVKNSERIFNGNSIHEMVPQFTIRPILRDPLFFDFMAEVVNNNEITDDQLVVITAQDLYDYRQHLMSRYDIKT